MAERIGYARVSTAGQDVALQVQALEEAGCLRIFTDQASGATTARPALDEALRFLREGDTLVVWKLDRLGRSLRHLLEVVEELRERGIGFRSLTEGFDTTTPAGRMLFSVIGALAEFERDLIRERTLAGLAVARANGRRGGGRRTVSAKQLQTARRLLADGSTHKDAAAAVGVSRQALYRALDTGAHESRAEGRG